MTTEKIVADTVDGLQAWGLSMAELNWVVFGQWDRLHHTTLTAEQYEELGNWSQIHTEDDPPITLTCGSKTPSIYIPGLFTRMGAPRCCHCCDRLSYPRGSGSPKNDDTLRPVVLQKLSDATNSVQP